MRAPSREPASLTTCNRPRLDGIGTIRSIQTEMLGQRSDLLRRCIFRQTRVDRVACQVTWAEDDERDHEQRDTHLKQPNQERAMHAVGSNAGWSRGGGASKAPSGSSCALSRGHYRSEMADSDRCCAREYPFGHRFGVHNHLGRDAGQWRHGILLKHTSEDAAGQFIAFCRVD